MHPHTEGPAAMIMNEPGHVGEYHKHGLEQKEPDVAGEGTLFQKSGQ